MQQSASVTSEHMRGTCGAHAGHLHAGRRPIQKLPAIQKLRLRNYLARFRNYSLARFRNYSLARFRNFFARFRNYFARFRNYSAHSETILSPQKLVRPIEKLFRPFRNYSLPTEAISPDSETIPPVQKLFSPHRNYFARFRNYSHMTQKLFAPNSEAGVSLR